MRRRTIPGLKEKLDNLYRKVNKPEFIALDPVKFPHRYKNRYDIEIAAFLAATVAWGRRDLILRSCERMFALMGESPYNYVMNGDRRKHTCGNSDGSRGLNIHRTFFEDDLRYFCRGFRACYTQYGSLEALFGSAGSVWEGIALLRETMAQGQGKQAVYSRHIANPDSCSACKRLNLALRWLVRREGPVDLGLWKSISPSSLFIPLDIHVGRAARSLGLLETRANDKKAVVALTEKLREFCPEDPVKYDLALFGY